MRAAISLPSTSHSTKNTFTAQDEATLLCSPNHQQSSSTLSVDPLISRGIETQVQELLSSIRQSLEIKHAFAHLLRLIRETPDPSVIAASIHHQQGEIVILQPMTVASLDPVLVCYSSVLIRKLCQFSMESISIVVEKGIIPMALSALSQFPNDGILQACVIRCLSILMHSSEHGRNEMLRHNVSTTLDLLLTSLTQHQVYSNITRHVQIYVCQVLITLCECDDGDIIVTLLMEKKTREDAMSIIGLVVLLLRQSMSQHDTKLMCTLSTLLLCLISKNLVVIQQIRACHGMVDLSMVVSMFPMDPGMVRYSTSALQVITHPSSQYNKEATSLSSRPIAQTQSTNRSTSPRRVQEAKPIRRYDFTVGRKAEAERPYTSREALLEQAYGPSSAIRRPRTSTKLGKSSSSEMLAHCSSGQLLRRDPALFKGNDQRRSPGKKSPQRLACSPLSSHSPYKNSRSPDFRQSSRQPWDFQPSYHVLTQNDGKSMRERVMEEIRISTGLGHKKCVTNRVPSLPSPARLSFSDKLHKMIEMAESTMNVSSLEDIKDDTPTELKEPVGDRKQSSSFLETPPEELAFGEEETLITASCPPVEAHEDRTLLSTAVSNLTMRGIGWTKEMSEDVTDNAITRVLHELETLTTRIEKSAMMTEDPRQVVDDNHIADHCDTEVPLSTMGKHAQADLSHQESDLFTTVREAGEKKNDKEHCLTEDVHGCNLDGTYGGEEEVSIEVKRDVGCESTQQVLNLGAANHDDDVRLSEYDAMVTAQTMAQTYVLHFVIDRAQQSSNLDDNHLEGQREAAIVDHHKTDMMYKDIQAKAHQYVEIEGNVEGSISNMQGKAKEVVDESVPMETKRSATDEPLSFNSMEAKHSDENVMDHGSTMIRHNLLDEKHKEGSSDKNMEVHEQMKDVVDESADMETKRMTLDEHFSPDATVITHIAGENEDVSVDSSRTVKALETNVLNKSEVVLADIISIFDESLSSCSEDPHRDLANTNTNTLSKTLSGVHNEYDTIVRLNHQSVDSRVAAVASIFDETIEELEKD